MSAVRNKFNSSLIVGSPRPHPAHSVPESSPMESFPRYISTTKEPVSSNTTRKGAPYAPRPPSTTLTIFTSAKTCATCPRYGASAFKPIDDYFSTAHQPRLHPRRRSFSENQSSPAGGLPTRPPRFRSEE